MMAMESVLGGIPRDGQQQETAHRLASLPMRLGGLGIRSAARMAPSAYWASWADALSMISGRLPGLADSIVENLVSGLVDRGCLAELQSAADSLTRSGFVAQPGWRALRAGAVPPHPGTHEPGEWQHGWQYHASSSLEHHFQETVILAQSCAADQAHLRSHSGPGASSSMLGSPSSLEFKLEPQLFRTLVFERLRLPLDVTEARCECGGAVDLYGRHRAACGRLRTRAVGPERTLARVCREAGATVRWQAKLRDMNVTVSANDERAIEVLASGLPLFQGAQLAVDITIRSVLTASGAAIPNTSHTDGVVVGVETGGRWSAESVEFINCLAAAKAREAPMVLRGSVSEGCRRRWTRMLSVSCSSAFACSLVSPSSVGPVGAEGGVPELADLLTE